MSTKDYTYANARIRCRESMLLSGADLERLLSSKNVEETIRLLKEKGWGEASEDESPSELLTTERKKLWDFIHEIAPEENTFDFFRVPNDFHNLKVAVKCVTRGVKPDDMFIRNATVPPEKIFEAVERREYDRLPDYLKECAKEAMSVLLQTSDGQLCDIVIDSACLSCVKSLGDASESDIVKMYCELYVASADIRTAVRSAKTGKRHDFITRALAPCESLNVEKLAAATAKGYDDIVDYLKETPYRSAITALEESLTAFEKWCDDYLTESLKPQKWEPFSIGPVIAFIFAKENELKAVRMILSGKLNSLDDTVIRERLRKMYV